MRKKIVLLGIIIVIVVVGAVIRIRLRNSAARSFADRPLAVYAYTVQPGEITTGRDFIGTLVATRQVTVTSQVTQKIRDIFKDENDPVRAGDILLRLEENTLADNRDAQSARVRSLQLAIDAKRARLTALEENVHYWTTELERDRTLLENHAIAQNLYDRTKNSYEQAASGLAAARIDINKLSSDLAGAEATLSAQRQQLDYTVIRANVNGVVSRRLVDEGDLAVVGKPLMLIDSTDGYQVRFSFPEAESRQITAGTPVRITALAARDDYAARISRVYPSVSADQTATAEIDLDTRPADDLLLGAYLRVRVITRDDTGVLRVPRDAVRRNEDGAFVYRITDGILHRQPVIRGTAGEGFVEIQDGLAAGETIATGSFLDLARVYDSQPVQVYGQNR